jgi:hypothetical protein
MRGSLLLVLLPLIAGCRDTTDRSKNSASTFDKRVQCAELGSSRAWEDPPDGPYLDETYYSPANDTCIFVMKQTFPAEKDREIQYAFFIVDGLSRKQLWSNDPTKNETEEQLVTALNQELTKLEVAK